MLKYRGKEWTLILISYCGSSNITDVLVLNSSVGPLFAGISIISQISTIAGTVLWNTIYAQTVDTQPGMVFSLAAVVCAINLILTLYVLSMLITLKTEKLKK